MTEPPEIYPMPAFPTLVVADLDASARWYQEVLGFQHIFTMPGPGGAPILVHLRWAKYGDILLRKAFGPPDERPKGVGVNFSFAVFDRPVDEVADRAHTHGAKLETEPKNQPWNARDFSLRDPDGYLLTFTKGPVEEGLTMDRIVQRARQGAR